MLKYVGDGWIDGVPARDLRDDEVQVYGEKRLLESGLYVKVKSKLVVNQEVKSEVKDGD